MMLLWTLSDGIVATICLTAPVSFMFAKGNFLDLECKQYKEQRINTDWAFSRFDQQHYILIFTEVLTCEWLFILYWLKRFHSTQNKTFFLLQIVLRIECIWRPWSVTTNGHNVHTVAHYSAASKTSPNSAARKLLPAQQPRKRGLLSSWENLSLLSSHGLGMHLEGEGEAALHTKGWSKSRFPSSPTRTAGVWCVGLLFCWKTRTNFKVLSCQHSSKHWTGNQHSSTINILVV